MLDSGLFTKARGLWFCVPAVPSIFSTMNSVAEIKVLYISTEVTEGSVEDDFEVILK